MRPLRETLERNLVPAAATVLLFWPSGFSFAADIPAAAVREAPRCSKELAEIRAALEAPAVIERLEEAGLTPEDVLARVEGMTPGEVRYVAERIREDPKAGGFSGFAAVVIVGLLVFLILVLSDKIDISGKKQAHLPSGVRAVSTPPAPGALLG